jgi:UDP-N-acetylmuramate dehydrogenase
MNIQQNVSLAEHSTMRLGGTAAFLCDITTRTELTEALNWAEERQLPTKVIGDGSNIVWKDDGFPGLIIVNKILRFEPFNEDEINFYYTVGAGENWDSVVARTVELGLTGIEALSLIPGTAGATPVQNVGAYGQEIADTLVTVEVYDMQAKNFLNLTATDCALGYRTSRFKTSDRGRFIITAITLHLTKGNPQPPYYASVQQYFDDKGITVVTPQQLRDAVIDIRSHKLPDPKVVANNGSFFANPIVDPGVLTQISASFADVPHWDTSDGRVKIPAAWLIEQAGFKDAHDTATGMGTWPNQPLVLVNEHATSTAQLIEFKQKIVDAVKAKFDITLEQEPELLP